MSYDHPKFSLIDIQMLLLGIAIAAPFVLIGAAIAMVFMAH